MTVSSSPPELIIPDGHSPPFATISENDHAAWIYIATALGLALILQFGTIRIIVRGSVCPGVGLDDIFVAASTIFALFQACLVLAATGEGLGRSIDLVSPSSQAKVQQLYYAGILLFVIALGLSKLSVIFFLLRLTSYDTHRRLFRLLAASTAVWTIGSFFAEALQCDYSHPWRVVNERCSGSYLRWQIICGFDIATEVVVVAMSVLLVWNVRAPFLKKAAVVITFTFRLIMIVPIAFRLETYPSHRRASNFFLAEDLFTVWTQTELNYSIISATIPTIRIFTTALNTQFGGLTENERSDYRNSQSKNSTLVDHEHLINSQVPTRTSTDASASRKASSTQSTSTAFGGRMRDSYSASALKYFNDQHHRMRGGQKNTPSRGEDEIIPAVPV